MLVLDIRRDILAISTAIGALMLIASILGFLGAFLHKKKLLISFLLLVWPAIAISITGGFLAYKERNDGSFVNHLSFTWDSGNSQTFIQEQFQCCGFYWALDRPVPSDSCQGSVASLTSGASFRRVLGRLQKRQSVDPTIVPSTSQDLPGCIATWGDYISTYLQLTYVAAFSTIPLNLFAFIVGILATNHIYH